MEEARLHSFRIIAQSFRADNFEPSYCWTSNEHYQTIVGSGALYQLLHGRPVRTFATSSEVFDTIDGDIFGVEYTDNFEQSESIVIIVHGLESSLKGFLVTRFAEAFLSKGFGCCLYGFRGCDDELPM
jgi:predicted alpha/beta-fold hydrolase